MSQKTINGINFKSLVAAGFIAGYLMYFIDHWFGGIFGLFGFFPGTKDPWWMLQHHIDSIIIALLFAWPLVYSVLPGRGWLKGTIFGLLWGIGFIIVSLIAGALGAKIFSQIPFNAYIVITSLLLHIFYGFFLGLLYVPEAGKASESQMS